MAGRRSLWVRILRTLAGAAIVPAILSVAVPADAQSSILHEFLPPDPSEDVSFATTTLDGDLPAAIQTPSGVATAPDPRQPPDSSRVYSGTTVDDGPDSTYEPDRDTRRPNVENYDDPFSPSTSPFKRLRAYDAVDADYSLKVRDRTLRPIPVGGAINAGDEAFYGDLSVDLVPDEPVRIPTVGPGARLLRLHANPEIKITVLHDDADNWFVRGSERTRVRVVMQLAIPRATFGSAFADVEWADLDKLVKPQPTAHQAAFKEVSQALGISRSRRPREVLSAMVEYFRAFAPSDEPPSGRGDIYLDLALSKKGVCRHRAFAFLVTALHIGIPARMVVNEAHAWVEAFDGALWHRIDLGGAAQNLDDTENDATRPPYVPPPDPFAWPQARDSGQELVDRMRTQRDGQPRSGSQSPGAPGSSSDPSAPGSAASPSPAASSKSDAETRSDTQVSVKAVDTDVRRGLPLHLQGEVKSAGATCAHVRVDIILVSASLPQGVSIGALSTDERGAYDGAVVVPQDFAVGDYELFVITPGDVHCAPTAVRAAPSDAAK